MLKNFSILIIFMILFAGRSFPTNISTKLFSIENTKEKVVKFCEHCQPHHDSENDHSCENTICCFHHCHSFYLFSNDIKERQSPIKLEYVLYIFSLRNAFQRSLLKPPIQFEV